MHDSGLNPCIVSLFIFKIQYRKNPLTVILQISNQAHASSKSPCVITVSHRQTTQTTMSTPSLRACKAADLACSGRRTDYTSRGFQSVEVRVPVPEIAIWRTSSTRWCVYIYIHIYIYIIYTIVSVLYQRVRAQFYTP